MRWKLQAAEDNSKGEIWSPYAKYAKGALPVKHELALLCIVLNRPYRAYQEGFLWTRHHRAEPLMQIGFYAFFFAGEIVAFGFGRRDQAKEIDKRLQHAKQP